ncbi:crossover junction endodeoxyribonuclease RuvC [Bacillus spizizenii]|uniref:crossover junction endodeoxyribonuclease RuvC n=1 Tax=Bacillus subtilis group TaxID=653685 RepID=UPI000A352875|nr:MULTISPECIES: crossover junction endodeoxyribonuclease RuvC [Bacillus subtilis group]MCY7802276.1 crossover junction endodeoxyribonuclease RuvC [Bacillus spizizenii]MBU8720507.1 crossover junction endodeoxyribonuclease RuvC [Bacillus subtilis]MCY8134615.1 crossover junction endodeoxyribonuclease RuvC [Bacillus spizizenii]MCY8307195.1 crossover junction endodeoxyribonuclease RuvC [Bacillus vallismortis]MCY9175162.1 crossover junction endodeoxyribonuclease RuvC [Bacillus inaquosorum]
MRFVGIDPSTKTGLLIQDSSGKVIVEEEIKTKVKGDPQRFMDIAAQVIKFIRPGDKVCIEDFSYGSTGQGVSIQYGIGWLIRARLINKQIDYIEVPPSVVKKFATGKGNAKKEHMVMPIYKHWGYEHKSDNVLDAYVLCQISRALHTKVNLTKYQQESLQKIS